MSRFSFPLSLLTVRLWRDLKVRTRLFLLIVMFLGLYLLFSLGGFYTLERLKIGGELYQQIKRYKDTIETITLLKSDLNESRMLQLSILEETDKAEIEAVQEEIKEISTYIDEDLATLLHQLPDGVIRVALRDAFVTWQDFKETREQQVFPALLAGNVDQARALVEDTQSLRYERFIEQIDSAIDAMRLKIEEIEKQVEKAVQQRITLLGAVTGGFMLLLVPVSLLLIHSITNPLQKMATVAHQLASGNIDQQVDYHGKNEIGTLATAFRDLITYITEISRAADALSRGDLTVTVPPRSSRDVLAQHFLQVTETLQGLVEETGGLIQAGQEGRLHHRGNASRFQGCYADLIDRINKMLDAILSPIQEASTVLEHVAARDLTVCMTGTYQGNHAQIKTALNTTVQNLNEGLHQVAIAAEQVAAASKQISAGNQSLAQGTSEQASALAKISGTLQAMASMSQQNAANAREARTLSENASQVTEKGTRSMQRLSEAIARIKNSADETTKVVQAIDDIAFQTNLLALNAAVEAARAGEAGKGFAVVAEEVRNLAMRSAEAAKSTARLIEESMHNAEEGVILNQEVLQNLEAINVQVQQVSTVMAEIAASSNQQQQGLEQIKMAMEEINQITQQNAAHSEETASAAEELSGQAELLQKLVATFHLAPGKASQIEGADQVSVAYELTV